MNQSQIRTFLEKYRPQKERTIVIVDFANVEKWKHGLGWHIGIQELANLVKNFSTGQRYLRRFYYGADYGPNDNATELIPWSKGILTRSEMNGFNVVAKRVKYIHSADNVYGYEKKCDLDVEMAVDLIKERDNYDTIILFSGDGDLSYALRYLIDAFDKRAYVFGARDHIGREMIDLKNEGKLVDIFYADDFEYRLNARRTMR